MVSPKLCKELNGRWARDRNDLGPGKIKKEAACQIKKIFADWAIRKAKELALDKLGEEAG